MPPTPSCWPGSGQRRWAGRSSTAAATACRSEPATGPFEIDFRSVPDGPKSVKNRLHLDIKPVSRDQAAELDRLLSLGAREVDVGQGSRSWYVLTDPEGNEFCLCRP